jgi:hypothetical protein
MPLAAGGSAQTALCWNWWQFNKHHEGPDELTDEELDRCLERFPVD